MSLTDELADYEKAHRVGRRCTLYTFLKGRKDAAEILSVVVSTEYGVPAVSDALRRRGFLPSRSALHFHRQRLCKTCVDFESDLKKAIK